MAVDFTAATADECRVCYWALVLYQYEYTAQKRNPQDTVVNTLVSQLKTRAGTLSPQLNVPPATVGSFLPEMDLR